MDRDFTEYEKDLLGELHSFGVNGPYVPYDVMPNTDRGYEVHIIDNPKEYQDREYFQQIYFTIAWESGITDEAWTLISFVTCWHPVYRRG